VFVDFGQNSRDMRGAFAGARISIRFGHRTAAKSLVALALAPTTSRLSNEGRIVTRIGEGASLNLAGRKPTLMLGGVRADEALGLRGEAWSHGDRKLGISNGAWIAIGAVAVIGTVVVITQLTCIGKDPDFCGSD